MWGHGVLPAALPAPFSATLSPALSVYLCVNVGPQGLLVVGLPPPLVPHSSSLGPATATRVLSAPPTGLDVCFFFIYLVLDFLADFLSVLVVRGGAVCLPTPPSWFSESSNFFSQDYLGYSDSFSRPYKY